MKTRLLVLQMCRLGDVLQTTPMLRGIRREQPDAHITLVLHEAFASAPIPSRLYDRLVAFPYNDLARGSTNTPWRTRLTRLQQFIDSLDDEPYDVLLNLTHSDLCSLLSTLIPAREVRGGIVAPDRTRTVVSPWMTYFWSSQILRSQGCFNLVDLHNWMAGVASDAGGLEIEVPPVAHERMQAWLRERAIDRGSIVAMQLGASEERKRWPAERFARMADLLPADVEVVLVGAAAERPLAERALAASNRRLHDAVGSTTLTDLAALLSRCAALVTNDTGTMHVAAAVGTRTIDISTGPVFVHETGPYGLGHFVLQPRMECFPCAAGSVCRHLSCRESIEPEDVAALVRHALGRGPMPRPPQARILTGHFTATKRIEYRVLWPDTSQPDEELRHAMARVWEETLVERDVETFVGRPFRVVAPPDNEAKASSHNCNEARASSHNCQASSHDGSSAHDRSLRQLAEKARRAAAIARRIDGAHLSQRQTLSAQLERCLQDVYLTGQLDTACQPLTAYLKVRLDSTYGADVAKLAKLFADECTATADRALRLAAALAEGCPATAAMSACH